jgi:hypothetical protein
MYLAAFRWAFLFNAEMLWALFVRFRHDGP